MARLKKWWFIWLLLAAVLYLIVGAIAPFMRYKQVSEETANEIDIVKTVEEANTDVDRVMLLETNESAWEERIRLLNLAQDRIIMSTFDMRQGESSSDIAAMLLHKAEEGVSVLLLIDGFNGSFRLPGEDFFYALSSHPNIEIRLYNPINLLTPWTSQGRMHDKYIIVDELAYILGGRNTFDYFIGNYPTDHKSYDREVLVYNTRQGGRASFAPSSLYEVEAYFNEVWNGGRCEPFADKLSLLKDEGVQKETARLRERYESIRSSRPELFATYDYSAHTHESEGVFLIRGEIGIYGKEPLVLYQLGELMKQARERVIIHTPYAVCNEYMYEVLREVKEAVPDTRLMLNSVENGDNFCASSDYLYNKGGLVDTGVQIYEYDGGNSYHGKSIVIDSDISIVGSFNYDLRSAYMDTELMLVIKSEELTRELSAYMESYGRQCRKVIDKDEYEVPEGIAVAKIPLYKKALMYLFGAVVQGFRYLL